MTNRKKPELLAPAGSAEALCAAVCAGADAVYMGLSRFNARINADNFKPDELLDAVKLCRLHQKKLYITLNTLIFNREIEEALKEAYFCAEAGVDAFIVQDIGLISLLKKALPEVEIHASTQCATHSLEQIKTLAGLGVSRAVVARELSEYDLREIMRSTPIEVEAFVHGALCMSHSGTCLMSAYMGGRSGNRGECAQPCRLPYTLERSDNKYPLSLRDLSLASHAKELIDMGIDSLKIEGRMKSAEYVYNTVSVWRRLIDENRNATSGEMAELERIFSRTGFTDGYYTLKKGKQMFGIRSADDKENTRRAERATEYKLPEIPVEAHFAIKDGVTAELSLKARGKEAKSSCEALVAEGAGTGAEVIRDAVTKLGDTPFVCESFEITMDSPVFLKRSSLNALRRETAKKLEDMLTGEKRDIPERKIDPPDDKTFENGGLWVIYAQPCRVDRAEVLRLFEGGAEKVFVPMSVDFECPDSRCGFLLPRAVFEKDREAFERELDRLKALGYECCLAENLGVGITAMKKGFAVYGGAGLSAVNPYSAQALAGLGFKALLLSGEVTEAQKGRMKSPVPLGDCVWGRAPLMLVENCIMGVRDNCFGCLENCHKKGRLTDRTGESFPVLPDLYHRSVIYNSRPTYRADLPVSEKISFRAIYITDEVSAPEILEKVKEGRAPDFKFTRK
jgi:putative protease